MHPRIGSSLALAAAPLAAMLALAASAAAQAGAPPAPSPAPSATAAAATKPAEFTLAQLEQRPDLWPARVTLHRSFKFSGGVVLKPGQEVGLHELHPQSVVLDGGGFLFECPVADTDALDRAHALIAALSPEQLALTWETLRGRPELWPLAVTLNEGIQLADGTSLPASQELALRGFDNDQISVCPHGSASFFTMEPQATDLLVRARERLKLPPAEREPFFVRAVEASLARPAGAAEHPLADADYLLVYKGRQGCTRCAAFAPELKQFYERMKAEHPRFEIIFLSDDASADGAHAFLAEHQMPGSVVAWDRRMEAAETATLPLQLLPGVFVFDRTGKLLEQNHPNGGSPSALDVLGAFEKQLKTAPVAAAPQPR